MKKLRLAAATTLVEVAREARLRAYAPYSNFLVGAALLSKDGRIFTGCNVENASYGGTICAERTALVTAVAAGHRSFRRCVVVSDNPHPITPCGYCRQFLAEFGLDLEVIAVGANGQRAAWTLRELLPQAFTGDDIVEGR